MLNLSNLQGVKMRNNLFELIEAKNIELVKEKIPLKNIKGLYFDNIIVLNSKINTEVEKKCVLAEELGHYETSSGNILAQNKIINLKQESKARGWAVDELIKVEDFIKAFDAGVRNRFELAEYLEVTEEFIELALDHFRKRHGEFHNIGDYTIFFNPLGVLKKL